MNLITDRTQGDANYAFANRSSPIPLKGSYNADDYNRVGAALNYLSGWLYGLGYGENLKLRTDWKTTENISIQDATLYLETIRGVKDSFYVMPGTPPLPEHIHDIFREAGYERANNIEKTLEALEKMIENMVASFIYSGEIYSGEW